ncbi:MAG: M28 family metallopeptidase [Planctomycetota bacterium]
MRASSCSAFERGFIEHDHHRQRMLTAKERGAVGLVYIYEEVSANPNGDLIEGFLPTLVTEKTADRLLAASGLTSAELRRELQETKKPRSFETAGQIRLKVEAEHFPDAEAYNVVGFVEGSDPVLKSEFIVIGGHVDHCGRHMGLVFPGADDNASGSACVIATARAFAALERPPKRSVLFALFGSEERGLIGSHLLAENLPPQAEKVAAMFNLDMEGEGDGVGAVHSPGRMELKDAIERADRCVGAVRGIREFRGVGVRSSDYAPFYRKEIPCIAFWSNGPHLHYHQPGDTIYRINPDMLADVSRLTFLTAYSLADG